MTPSLLARLRWTSHGEKTAIRDDDLVAIGRARQVHGPASRWRHGNHVRSGMYEPVRAMLRTKRWIKFEGGVQVIRYVFRCEPKDRRVKWVRVTPQKG